MLTSILHSITNIPCMTQSEQACFCHHFTFRNWFETNTCSASITQKQNVMIFIFCGVTGVLVLKQKVNSCRISNILNIILLVLYQAKFGLLLLLKFIWNNNKSNKDTAMFSNIIKYESHTLKKTFEYKKLA